METKKKNWHTGRVVSSSPPYLPARAEMAKLNQRRLNTTSTASARSELGTGAYMREAATAPAGHALAAALLCAASQERQRVARGCTLAHRIRPPPHCFEFVYSHSARPPIDTGRDRFLPGSQRPKANSIFHVFGLLCFPMGRGLSVD